MFKKESEKEWSQAEPNKWKVSATEMLHDIVIQKYSFSRVSHLWLYLIIELFIHRWPIMLLKSLSRKETILLTHVASWWSSLII